MLVAAAVDILVTAEVSVVLMKVMVVIFDVVVLVVVEMG